MSTFKIGDEVQYSWKKGYLGKIIDDSGFLLMIEELDGNIVWVPSNDLELFELTTPPELTTEEYHKVMEEVSLLFEDYKKCECGKDKHGFARHSQWCRLYE